MAVVAAEFVPDARAASDQYSQPADAAVYILHVVDGDGSAAGRCQPVAPL